MCFCYSESLDFMSLPKNLRQMQVIQVGSRCQPVWGPIFLIQPTVWCWPLKISSSAARCWALWIMQCCLTALSKSGLQHFLHAGHRQKKKTRLAWAGFLWDTNRVKNRISVGSLQVMLFRETGGDITFHWNWGSIHMTLEVQRLVFDMFWKVFSVKTYCFSKGV